MYYRIRHVTRFLYSQPVSESIMEVRLRPRSETQQQCLKFDLVVSPKVRVHQYRDYLGNTIHYFDQPAMHNRLSVTAEAVVEVDHPMEIPEGLPMTAWAEIDRLYESGDMWEFQNDSHFSKQTPALAALADELRLKRRTDPLSLLRQINDALYHEFEYVPKATRVDSPIDVALENRKGVCQDFTHIMIALARHLRIPCRYVSGYLYPRAKSEDRSTPGSTHAWLEAWLPGAPGSGWVGFDPTNHTLATDRHIRVAIGRDYQDVPPSKGVYKGNAKNELQVAVRVTQKQGPLEEYGEVKDELVLVGAEIGSEVPLGHARDDHWDQVQQQQQ